MQRLRHCEEVVGSVAWMTMMGAESVAYHRATVIERADDFAGQALDYYGSRGETPLVWGGAGASRLGLSGNVADEEYLALFGPGGAVDPRSGERLATTRRPGMELVVSAHKSVAELGVIGYPGMMHGLLDAERDATLAHLDRVTAERGGRRGRERRAVATGGLTYAHTRHATSRAGDPCPHDHVLVVNLVEMADGGWKAADTALWRDELHAATMVGRLASARVAVELGLGIEADPGRSGRLGHWRLCGIPDEVLELHSKRTGEIDAHLETRGWSGVHARAVAARETRKAKRFEPVGKLTVRWRKELAEIGWSASRLREAIDAHRRTEPPGPLSPADLDRLVATTLAPDGPLARDKVFTRADVIVAVAPALFGRPLPDLDRVVEATLGSAAVLPLVGVVGARDRHYTLAHVVVAEQTIEALVAEGAATTTAAVLAPGLVNETVVAMQARLGRPLTAGQRAAIVGICTEGRLVSLVLGVAGSGKTTALAGVAAAYEAQGYQVVGTATSGQAARTLGCEAGIENSRTLASLLWRIDHDRLVLHRRTVVILDEAGMTSDPHLVRLLAEARAADAKVVLVGDDRQLGAVGPGGALGALLERHGGLVHVLNENVRQADPTERKALAQLRAGQVAKAVAWYADHGRIEVSADRETVIHEAVQAWAEDVARGRESQLLAWRRGNVERLNQAARQAWRELGHLRGPDLEARGGRRYAVGDLVVTLAPGPDGRLVTSQRGQVIAVDRAAGALTVLTDDGQTHQLGGEAIGADRLAHSYALTVHRAQGLTVDRSHHLADGGGRELAYVAMSRARETTTVHVVADDRAQAVEDLRREWSYEKRPHWAIDTGTTRPDLPRRARLLSPETVGRLHERCADLHSRIKAQALIASARRDQLAGAGHPSDNRGIWPALAPTGYPSGHDHRHARGL